MARSLWYLLLMAIVLSTPPAFSASLPIDASLSRVYEDNVNPLLSGVPVPFALPDRGRESLAGAQTNDAGIAAEAAGTETSDAHTVLSASIGASSIVGVETDLSIKAEASRTGYVRFSGLDATTVGLRLDLFKQFSDVNSSDLSIVARRNWYREHALDGSTWAVVLDVRQQPSSRLRVNEEFMYERNSARSPLFSYAGRMIAIRSDYGFAGGFSAGVGYACLFRRFESGVQVLLHSGSLTGRFDVNRQIRISASLEHQRYDIDPLSRRAGNNISFLGVGFSY